MRRFLKDNGLSIAMFAMFFATLVGMTIVGMNVYNEDQQQHGEQTVGYVEYLQSPNFMESVFENWESEFLQMGSYVLLTVFLFQRGSSESKDPDKTDEEIDREPDPRKPGAPAAVRRGGRTLAVFSHSLTIALFALFALSFVLHAIGGAGEYSAQQMAHGGKAVSVLDYLTTNQMWFESFQNWQSEYLSVGVLIVLSVFLREKGSPESKPVDAPHAQTGSA